MRSVPRGKLSSLFLTAAVGFGALFSNSCGNVSDKCVNKKLGDTVAATAQVLGIGDQCSPDGIPLALDERVFLSVLFGNKINTEYYSKVFADEKSTNGRPAVTIGNQVVFLWILASLDYTKEQEPTIQNSAKFGTFVHESVHVFGNQIGTGMGNRECFVKGGNKNYEYEFDIISGKSFDDLCIEQQASVVEGYARRFLHPYRFIPLEVMTVPETFDAALIRVVEGKFPSAYILRKEFEDKHGRVKYPPRPQNMYEL